MANQVLKKLFGDEQKRKLKKLQKSVDLVNELSDKMSKLDDKKLQVKTDEFRKRVENNESLDDILPEAFAAVREAAQRTLGMRHYDVQVMAGVALHQGSVAELHTGEGKTLMATLPVYLNGLSGKGVHVVTVNDYLAQRDAGWNAPLYYFMGLSTAVIVAENSYIYDPEYSNDEHDDERFRSLKPCTRQEAYAADITYGTNNEFGFDYLRDNMVREIDRLRQRKLNYAIVDEVDSILIDEARTPLIISAPAMSSGSSYATFASVAKKLKEDHYELDEKRKSAVLTDDGVAKVQSLLDIDNLYAPENVRMIYHMDQALRAQTLFKRDKDYVVSDDNEVIIVDEFTGRLMHGRRYNEGLHQAIEAKEGVEVLQESMTLATISFQNYFRLYDKLAGMTGTAETESEEFYQIYKLDVVVVPTNKPNIRDDRTDRIYKTKKAKFSAIIEEVRQMQEKGQPVLIGTSSIENNEVLSRLLAKAGIKHNVLNAKHHEQEAAIVAKAGQQGAVTLATNIAGRGTDIKLADGVKELGGLFVIGSERHESRRIDNQLRGRTGRQGDPGATQFYVSVEDDLMRIFGGDRVAGLMNRLGLDDDVPIENKSITKALETAQKKVESYHFDNRKNVVQYDDVMNRHRKSIYSTRQTILSEADISDQVQDLIDDQVAVFEPKEGEKTADLAADIAPVFGFTERLEKELANELPEKFPDELRKNVQAAYKAQEEAFTPEIMRKVEKEVYLQILDNLWMQHLENMGHLREGINWRSVGQRDPLVEYRREGQRMFEQMQADLRSEIVRSLFHAKPASSEEFDEPIETELTKAAEKSVANSAQETPTVVSKKGFRRGGITTKQPAEGETSQASVVAIDDKAEKKRKREASKKKKAGRKKGRKK